MTIFPADPSVFVVDYQFGFLNPAYPSGVTGCFALCIVMANGIFDTPTLYVPTTFSIRDDMMGFDFS